MSGSARYYVNMTDTPLIYYVEDDMNIRDLTSYALRKAGFEVEGFEDGENLLQSCCERMPEAVLLDIMLPGKDGIELMQILRSDDRTARVPIMLLTAKGTEYDKVSGLDAGADDYLAKPFGMMELISRLNALLRRSGWRAEKDAVSGEAPSSGNGDGCIQIHSDEFRACVNGEPLSLTRKEFRLLKKLVDNSGKVLTRDQLLEDVWGMTYPGGTRTVDMHIRALRKKMSEACPGCDSMIETVRGVGYRFQERNA